jgi:chromosomal replication initiator protein
MSEVPDSIDIGGYATARGRICADDYDFVRGCVKRRVPSAHIAQMINRPIAEVRELVYLLDAQAVAAGEIPAPEPPVVVLSLFRGLIKRRPGSRGILEDVASQWGISVNELVGEGRAKRFALPRHEAMYRLRETGRYSFPQIAAIFGRDHTSVMHGVKRHKQRLAEAAEG